MCKMRTAHCRLTSAYQLAWAEKVSTLYSHIALVFIEPVLERFDIWCCYNVFREMVPTSNHSYLGLIEYSMAIQIIRFIVKARANLVGYSTYDEE